MKFGKKAVFKISSYGPSITGWAQQQHEQDPPIQNANATATTSSFSTTSNSSIADLIREQQSNDVSLLALACQQTFLWRFLNDTTTSQVLTFLGPNDDAFQLFISLPPFSNYFSDSWILHLQQLVLFHIIPSQALNSSQLLLTDTNNTTTTSYSWPTALGEDLFVNASSRTLGYWEEATLLVSDQVAANGYWHIPDQVLLPDTLHVNVLQALFNNDSSVDTSSSSLFINRIKYTFNTMETLLQTTKTQYMLAASSGTSDGFTILATPDDPAWQSLALDHGILLQQLFQSQYYNVATNLILYHMAPLNIYSHLLFVVGNTQPTTNSTHELYFTMLNQVSAWFTAVTTTTTTTNATTTHSTNTSLPGTNSSQSQSKTTTTFFVNGARVLQDNVLASNGVIKVIDQVLVPPNVLEQLTLTTEVTTSYSFFQFLAILELSGINLTSSSERDSLTILAPLDAAFEVHNNSTNVPTIMELVNKLVQDVWIRHLQSFVYHHITNPVYPLASFTEPTKLFMSSGYAVTLVSSNSSSSSSGGGGSSGGKDTVIIDGTTRVVLPDLFATNGVIHGIDRVLLPPSVTQSIYQQLLANPTQFSTLILLLQATNLTSLFQDSNSGPITLFAPTNDAFPGISYTRLTLPKLLLGHAISSNIFTDQLVNGTMLQVHNGIQWQVQINRENDTDVIVVGSAQITLANVLASNGVIHVINTVLQAPNGTTVAPSTVPHTSISPSRAHSPNATRVPSLSRPSSTLGNHSSPTMLTPTGRNKSSHVPSVHANGNKATTHPTVFSRSHASDQNTMVPSNQLPTIAPSSTNNINSSSSTISSTTTTATTPRSAACDRRSWISWPAVCSVIAILISFAGVV